jgi:hypothetical protein
MAQEDKTERTKDDEEEENKKREVCNKK